MSTSIVSSTSKPVNTKSTNSIHIDRGCDIETGRYWARVGAEYQTFWSSMIRDQWIDAKRAEAK